MGRDSRLTWCQKLYGCVISSGTTALSNSSAVRKPDFIAASFRLLFSLKAILAILDALS